MLVTPKLMHGFGGTNDIHFSQPLFTIGLELEVKHGMYFKEENENREVSKQNPDCSVRTFSLSSRLVPEAL